MWQQLRQGRQATVLAPDFAFFLPEDSRASRCQGTNFADFAKFAPRLDAIPHRPVAALPPVPHPQQRRVAGVNKVDDPHAGLAGVLAVQAPGVLLQRPLPGHRDIGAGMPIQGGRFGQGLIRQFREHERGFLIATGC